MIFRRGLTVSLLLLVLGTTISHGRGDPTIKMGLGHLIVSGASYAIEVDPAATPTDSESGELVGNDFFFEWMLGGRLGIEVGYSLTPLSRDYEINLGTLSQGTETTTALTYGANIYFSKNTTRGFQFLLGLGGGSLAVSQEYTGGTLDGEKSSVTIPITWLKVGMDWLLPNGGIRLAYSSMAGTLTDTTQIVGYKQTYNYALGVMTLGVFSFF